MPPSNPSPFPSSNQERFEDARRIEVRPRAGGASRPVETAESSDVVLNFSCPSCLEMLAAPKVSAQSSVQCPSCSAFVMPPKIVSMVGGATGGSKTMLPPPRKSGTQALRH